MITGVFPCLENRKFYITAMDPPVPEAVQAMTNVLLRFMEQQYSFFHTGA